MALEQSSTTNQCPMGFFKMAEISTVTAFQRLVSVCYISPNLTAHQANLCFQLNAQLCVIVHKAKRKCKDFKISLLSSIG